MRPLGKKFCPYVSCKKKIKSTGNKIFIFIFQYKFISKEIYQVNKVK